MYVTPTPFLFLSFKPPHSHLFFKMQIASMPFPFPFFFCSLLTSYLYINCPYYPGGFNSFIYLPHVARAPSCYTKKKNPTKTINRDYNTSPCSFIPSVIFLLSLISLSLSPTPLHTTTHTPKCIIHTHTHAHKEGVISVFHFSILYLFLQPLLPCSSANHIILKQQQQQQPPQHSLPCGPLLRPPP